MPRSPSCCPESRRSVPEGRNATQLGRGYSGPWSRSSIRRLLFAFHSPQTAARPPVQVLRGPFPAEPRRGRVRHPTRNRNLRPLSFCFLESEVSVPPDDRGIFFFFLSPWKPTGASPGSRGPGVQKFPGDVPRSTFAPRVGHAVAPFLWSTYALRSRKNSRIAPWTSSLRVASLPLGDSAWLFRHRTPGLILSLCL